MVIDDSRPELVFTLFMMGVLLIAAIAAVVIFFRLEPVAVFILVAMLAFIAFIAWQISLMPDK